MDLLWGHLRYALHLCLCSGGPNAPISCGPFKSCRSLKDESESDVLVPVGVAHVQYQCQCCLFSFLGMKQTV